VSKTCNYYIDKLPFHEKEYQAQLYQMIFFLLEIFVIQCKFYYNKDNLLNNGICNCEKKCTKKGSGKGQNQCLEISFMIFSNERMQQN